MINIFSYLDYRKYLKTMFKELKKHRTSFSHRAFAMQAGFKSSNFIMLVMQGKRNLSGHGIQKVAHALKLKKNESEFFENMVRFNQAKTDTEKNFYYKRIIANKEYAKARPLEKEQYKYYSKWFIPVIREMVILKDFKEDLKWIAERVFPNIKERDAKEAIDLLLEIGLLSRDKKGKLIQDQKHIFSGDKVSSLAFANFQRHMIELASISIENTHPAKREIASITFSISEEKLKQAKKMIRDFRSKLSGFLSEEEEASEVYQFNIQLFNLSKDIRKEQ